MILDLPPKLVQLLCDCSDRLKGPRLLVHGIGELLTSVCATAPCTARASGF